METVSRQLLADLGGGRLPDPVINWPIAERRFAELTRQWRNSNCWISLWNQSGKLVTCDEQAGRIWDALRAEDTAFSSYLSSLAGKLISEENAPGPAEFQDKNPWQPDLNVVVTPVLARQQRIGCVIGCFFTSEGGGEAFTRLCDQCKLDRKAAGRWLEQSGTVHAQHVPSVASLLAFTIGQARDLEVAGNEISILTDNLENTYEELHLIYEISRRMGIPQQPLEMLQNVTRELLEVSRAAGAAFVLHGQGHEDGESERHHPMAGELPHDRMMQIGCAAPSIEALERLAASVQVDSDSRQGYLLLNNASQQPGLEWASGWLKHLAVLPLCQDDRNLGMFYAVNCKDEGDFTSVDVQLLRAVADRMFAALQNQSLYDDLTDLLMGLLHALVNSVDAKDPYTYGHSARVAFLSRALAQAWGLPEIDCQRVYLAGLLHDVGKIGVPDAVLCKPGKLTKEEFDALKKHAEIGEHILSRVRQIRDLIPGVLYHHERMDGRGYPRGLAGRDIPMLGRVVCLADSFDAMTTNRTYRSAMPVLAAIAEVRRCAGTQFDPELAEAFLDIGLGDLYRQAHDLKGENLNIGRIGALCCMLSGHPKSWKGADSGPNALDQLSQTVN